MCLIFIVLFLVPVASSLAEVISDFEVDADGWAVINGDTPHQVALGGNPDGYLYIGDGSGNGYAVAPPKFCGNWNGFGALVTLSADIFLQNTSGNSPLDVPYIFRISGPGGAAYALAGSAYYPSEGTWTHHEVPLEETSWLIESGTWESILEHVTYVEIRAEFVDGDEIVGLDNVRLSSDPIPVDYFESHLTGTYSGNEVWYPVHLCAGQGISIVLSAQMVSEGLDFGLFDAMGIEIGGSNDSSITDGQTGIAEKTVHQTGTYFIKIWGSSGATGNYDLRIYNAWFNAGVTDSDRDYFSTYYTAHYIANGTYSATGIGEYSYSAHVYRFTAQPGTQIEVSVAAHLA
jgi:hypothetical protein